MSMIINFSTELNLIRAQGTISIGVIFTAFSTECKVSARLEKDGAGVFVAFGTHEILKLKINQGVIIFEVLYFFIFDFQLPLLLV